MIPPRHVCGNELFARLTQYVMPRFQRYYMWDSRRRQRFIESVEMIIDGDIDHWLGAILVQKGTRIDGAICCYNVIDGQQRLTTILIFVLALAHHHLALVPRDEAGELPEQSVLDENLHYSIYKSLLADYVVNNGIKGEGRLRLRLRELDRNTFAALVDGHKLSKESKNIRAAYEYFCSWLAGTKRPLADIREALPRFWVDIVTADERADAYRLFVTMNASQMPVQTIDQVNTAIAVALNDDDLYDQHFLPLLERYDFNNSSANFADMAFDYITARAGKEIELADMPQEFYNYIRKTGTAKAMADLDGFAEAYRYLLVSPVTHHGNKAVERAVAEFRLFMNKPFRMIAARCLEDLAAKKETAAAVIEAIGCLNAYLVRRLLVNVRGLSMRRVAIRYVGSQQKTSRSCRELVPELLVSLAASLRFPCDEEFVQSALYADFYGQVQKKHLLGCLERVSGSKEWAEVTEATCEHIMPQSIKEGSPWSRMLGPDWYSVQDRLGKTLGNIALTGYNTELSNRPFEDKVEAPVYGYRASLFRNTKCLADCSVWDEAAILARGRRLALEMAARWPRPVVTIVALPDEVAALAASMGDAGCLLAAVDAAFISDAAEIERQVDGDLVSYVCGDSPFAALQPTPDGLLLYLDEAHEKSLEKVKSTAATWPGKSSCCRLVQFSLADRVRAIRLVRKVAKGLPAFLAQPG